MSILIRTRAALLARTGSDDRGDVPGWVMVTLMTAGLVIALWGVAGSRLAEIFTEAIDSVLSTI